MILYRKNNTQKFGTGGIGLIESMTGRPLQSNKNSWISPLISMATGVAMDSAKGAAAKMDQKRAERLASKQPPIEGSGTGDTEQVVTYKPKLKLPNSMDDTQLMEGADTKAGFDFSSFYG
jgi:hypothetical protein